MISSGGRSQLGQNGLELTAVAIHSQIGHHWSGLDHDDRGKQAEGAHHVHQSAEAGGNLGRILRAELRIDRTKRER